MDPVWHFGERAVILAKHARILSLGLNELELVRYEVCQTPRESVNRHSHRVKQVFYGLFMSFSLRGASFLKHVCSRCCEQGCSKHSAAQPCDANHFGSPRAMVPIPKISGFHETFITIIWVSKRERVTLMQRLPRGVAHTSCGQG